MANENSLQLIQALYVAYYGRPADPEGLTFWANTLELNNGNIQAILGDFGNSAEYVQRFGSLDDTTLINNLYQQLFGRDAEPEGLGFWSGLLINNQLNLAQIAHSMLNGAQSIDRQVVEGRVQAAAAFTQQLDTPEENAAYGTSRGIEIGKAYLQQVTASNGVVPVLGKVVDTVATLLPSTPAPTPGGGGGTPPPPAPTFEVIFDNGVLSFAGTQTGAITVTTVSHEVIFTRGALSDSLSVDDYTALTEIVIGDATVVIPAPAINGLIITGTGNLQLAGVDDSLDLSCVASSVDVIANVSTDLDLTQTTGLDTVDAFVLATGVRLTLSVAQKANADISGTGEYALKDTADTLAALSSLELNSAAHIEVTDAATIDQLETLSAATGTLNYSTVKGAAIDLQADAATNGGDGTFVTDGKNVLVTGAATVAQLNVVKTAIGSGKVTAADITDDVGNLLTAGTASNYISVGTNVIVNDAASVAQIAILDAANGTGSASGTLFYTLTDSLAHLLAANDDLVADATSITLSGGLTLDDVSVAELVKVLSWNNLTGVATHTDLTYNLVDTAANLIAGGVVDDYVRDATAVTANAPANVYEATALYALNIAASYNITDNAASLATTATASVDAINHGGNLIATSPATAAQAKVIHDRTNSGDTTYNVTDTYANLTNGTYAASIGAAQNLTVSTPWLSQAQADAIVDLGNQGLTTIQSIRDSADNINTFVGSNAWDDDLHYNFYVQDSASNIISALASSTRFVTGNSAVLADPSVKQINVTGTFNLANAEIFWKAVEPTFFSAGTTTAEKTYYEISDNIANYISDETSGGSSAITTWVHDADRKVVTGNAADIEAAQNADRLIFGELDGNDSIIATGSTGDQSLQGSAGSDTLDGGDGDDEIHGNDGFDTLTGGAGFDRLYGGDGRDTITAGDSGAPTGGGASNLYVNRIYGGNDGDNLFGSSERDNFIFTGSTREALIAESGTQWNTRDYITHFSQGDTITFQGAQTLQFLGTGSGNNASPVAAGSLGLSIRYDKGLAVQNWEGNGTVTATLVSVDIADANGYFDNVADMHIVLVGTIDINAAGNSITFGA